ncbi:hypothetical protein WJX73_009114 [Symbiochloris irregularis]|uniref:CsbD-like domain-containing protein n=1 Tax=Symbiochloris irregularis TaxID=706552 RepID=A0AAW1P4Y3_9CHLO
MGRSVFCSVAGDEYILLQAGCRAWAQGQAEKLVGDVTGANDWKASGEKHIAEGNSEVKAAQAKGYAEGTKDRVHGKVQELGGKITGDNSKEAEGKARNTAGDLKQDANK